MRYELMAVDQDDTIRRVGGETSIDRAKTSAAMLTQVVKSEIIDVVIYDRHAGREIHRWSRDANNSFFISFSF